MGDCPDTFLEGFRITDEGYLWIELIPKYYCCWTEWILIIWGIGMNKWILYEYCLKARGCMWRVRTRSLKIWRYLDGYIAIYDSMKHDKACVCPSIFQRSPTQVIKHTGDTFIRGIIMFHTYCSSPLYHFGPTYILLSRGRPHRGSIFDLGRTSVLKASSLTDSLEVLMLLLMKPGVLLAFAVMLPSLMVLTR